MQVTRLCAAALVAMVVVGSMVACSPKAKEKSLITTSADQKTYVNEYFGLQVSKPDGWFAQDIEAMMKMSSEGAGLLAGDDKERRAAYDRTLKKTVQLFSFFEKEPGAVATTNANLMGVAENIEVLTGIKKGCDYLGHARLLLEKGSVPLKVADGCKELQVGAAKLGFIDVTMQMGAATVQQRYYACVKGGHAIGVVQTWMDDAGHKKVDEALQSIKLDCV